MAAAILARAGTPLVHNQAGANMAGGIASTLLAAARPGGGIAGELGLFEVDELWLEPVAAQLHPRAILLGNLFRDQLDRYGELETIADRWAQAARTGPARSSQLVLNADDPLIADLGRERDEVLYFGVEDDSLALAGMAHAPMPSTAAAAARHMCSTPSTSVTSATTTARAAAGPGHPGGARHGRRPRRRAGGALRAAHPRRRSRGRTGACPASTTSTTRSRPRRLQRALEVPLASIVAGLQATRAAFGRAETVTLELSADAGRDAGAAPARRELRILLVKNPAGANEVLRTLALEPGRARLLGVLNDNIADGRDVSWIWDADFELLAGRVRRVTCSGTRAAELAVRLKYAGIEPGRIRVQPDLPLALREAAGGTTTVSVATAISRPLYALPTYTAMLVAARAARRARGGEQRMVVTSTKVVWHDLECGSYRADLPLWRALAVQARDGPVLDIGAGTGRVALDLARAAHRVTALDLDPELLGALRDRGRWPRGRDRLRRRALVRAAAERLRAVPRADADDPAARRRGRASRVPALRTRPPAPRRAARLRDRHRVGAVRLRRRLARPLAGDGARRRGPLCQSGHQCASAPTAHRDRARATDRPVRRRRAK